MNVFGDFKEVRPTLRGVETAHQNKEDLLALYVDNFPGQPKTAQLYLSCLLLLIEEGRNALKEKFSELTNQQEGITVPDIRQDSGFNP
jgi:hypothetical protein